MRTAIITVIKVNGYKVAFDKATGEVISYNYGLKRLLNECKEKGYIPKFQAFLVDANGEVHRMKELTEKEIIWKNAKEKQDKTGYHWTTGFESFF